MIILFLSDLLIGDENKKRNRQIYTTLRLLGMSWGVKTTCLEAPGVSLGSGVSIGGVGSLRVGGGFKDFLNVHPENWGRSPI